MTAPHEKDSRLNRIRRALGNRALSYTGSTGSGATAASLALNGPAPAFGVSLSELSARDGESPNEVPTILRHLCDFLEAHGLYTVGLFRVSPSQRAVSRLRCSMDRLGPDALPLEAPQDVLPAATLLKQFLRDLPEPVIPAALNDVFLSAVKAPCPEEELRKATDCLPLLHFRVLRYLLRFLFRISLAEATNRMSPEALAVVFAPNLMPMPPKMAQAKQIQFCADSKEVILKMITSCSAIYGPDPDLPCVGSNTSLSEIISDKSANSSPSTASVLGAGGLAPPLLKSRHASLEESDSPPSLSHERKYYQRSSSEEYGGSPSEEAGSPSGFDGSRRASSHGDLISGFNIQPSCQDSEGCETPVPTPEPDAGLAMALPLVAEPGGMELEARRDAERNFRGRRRSVSKKREDGNNNVETSKVEGGAQSSPVHGRSLIGPTSSSAPLPTPTPLSTSTAASTTLSSQDLTEVEDTGLLPFDLTYSIGQEDSEPVVCKLHDEGVAIPSPRSSFSMPRGGNLKYLSTSDGSTRSADAPEGLPQYEADLPPSPPEFQVLDETPRGPPKLIYDPAYNTKKSLVKKISRLKRKLQMLETKFEEERGFRPSKADRWTDPDMKDVVEELRRCKLELKWLRDERNDGRAQRTKQNEKENLASTVQEIEKRLKELRLESNRPESLSDMDEDQIVAEKLCLQRGLIFLEREHGRPTNKEAKQVVFRLYDRYRTLKRLIARAEAVKASSLIPIAEHVEMATFEYEISVQRRGSAEEDETNTAPGTIEGPISPSRHPYNDSSPVAGYTEEELAQSVLTQALEGSSDDPLTELKREREKLLDQRRDLKAKIRSYEDTFERAGGGSPAGMSRSIDDRRLRSGPTEDDRAPLDKIYRQYKEVRARIRLTEALLTKQGQRI